MKKIKSYVINASLFLFSLFLSLLFVEIFFRLFLFGIDGAPFRLKNWAVEGIWDVERAPVELNYEFGWVPEVGSFKKNTPPHLVTINKFKFRNNDIDDLPEMSEEKILFSGDSFTFGDGVDDENTFPSIFQKISGSKVINAGVPGYGIDQMYLRSLKIIQKYKISDLFFCFIPDDINRCNNSTFHKVQKPYFILSGDSTMLKSINPLNFSKVRNFNLSLFHKIGGYSLVIDKIMQLFFPKFWSYSTNISKKIEHNNGKEISIKLILDLKQKCDEKNINFFVVPLAHQRYSHNHVKSLKFVLNPIGDQVNIINIFNGLESIRYENPDLFSSYFLKDNYHFSIAGNEFVGNAIYEKFMNSKWD